MGYIRINWMNFWWFLAGFRERLASKAVSQEDVSLWSVLKQCIGKELSKITMPISFNEPLSFLQRLTEYMEYSQLLHTAHQTQDPIERMQVPTYGPPVSIRISNHKWLDVATLEPRHDSYRYSLADLLLVSVEHCRTRNP